MGYVLQRSLFSYEEFVEASGDDNTRLVATLAALPDESLLAWLRAMRAGRRDDYPLEVLWRCEVAKRVYQLGTYAELIRELRRNGSLRLVVGIPSIERVPRDYHFSRFLKLLSVAEKQGLLRGIFDAQVESLSASLPEMGRHVAVDGTAVHAYSNEMRRRKSDPDAAWSARPKRQRRGGQVTEQLAYWYGYEVHLVADCATELPVWFEVTPANVSETTRFVPLLEGLAERHPTLLSRTKAVLADAGYDSAENCRHVLEKCKALPIIKMRLTQPKDAICQASEGLCTELGTQLCLGGQPMVYAGRDGDYLKWRCPVACGRLESCPERGRCTTSAYGAVRKVDIRKEPRRYPGLWRDSKKWTRLYRKRTAVERLNGRLKDFLQLDGLTVRGIAKARVHTTVSLICLLAGAQAMVNAERLEDIRRTVRMVA
jgi:IS5 family transposase